ncbi:phage Gp37/Gp68 family protein [Actinosynnema sp. NPDC023587]|uniref:phage Gp37/Gp68 family protein n=1 Tax=Actinosynnema sp. NPDC023587 TaxID=3154695 RepID=UPI003404F6CE
MAADSLIEWTDHTFNLWYGCARESPACRNCYADPIANRFGGSLARSAATRLVSAGAEPGTPLNLWRRHGPRLILSEHNARKPLAWNRAAKRAGVPARVFCSSMSDVFEQHPVLEVNAELDAERARLWKIIEQTPWLRWQLLTKRIDLVSEMVPWGNSWPANVWIGTSVETMKFADQRIPELLKLPAKIRFLSCEPMLEELDLHRYLGCWRRTPTGAFTASAIDWVIAGGESGPQARPMHPEWVRGLRDQCSAYRVPYFFKQRGEWTWEAPAGDWSDPQLYVDRTTRKTVDRESEITAGGSWTGVWRTGRKRAGRLIDGQFHNAFPEAA